MRAGCRTRGAPLPEFFYGFPGVFRPTGAEIVVEFCHLSIRQISKIRRFRNFQKLSVKPIASGLRQHFFSDPTDAESYPDRLTDLVEGLFSFSIA